MLVAIFAASIFVLQSGYFMANIVYLLRGAQAVRSVSSSPDSASTSSTPNQLVIPSLDISVPIVESAGASESEYQTALRHGVVHYPGTATVGKPGNAYIFGHSSDYPWSSGAYKSVFALLPKIADGASIYASDGDGRTFEYRVTGTAVVGPKDKWVLDQHGNVRKMLTLQTSYPLGTALKRFVVFTEIVE